MNKEIVSFSFGENWLNYIETFNEEKYNEVEQSMMEFFKGAIKDKTFIDIGCGSGIFSLAAMKLGAKRVLSIDADPKSVAACEKIKKELGVRENWEIINASILDENFIKKTGSFDIVYSWGVLHHTGSMWKAIDNATCLVRESGLLAIAIYNKAATSFFWLWFKRLYNRQKSEMAKKAMVLCIFMPRLIVRALSGKKPFKDRRGMSLYYNAVDWAGGLPYEYASSDEIILYLNSRGFELAYSKITKRTGCNEFLFKRKN